MLRTRNARAENARVFIAERVFLVVTNDLVRQRVVCVVWREAATGDDGRRWSPLGGCDRRRGASQRDAR